MNPTGTLRKRRRRNLAKVNGLSTIPYDETLDTFGNINLEDYYRYSSTRTQIPTKSSDHLILRLSSTEAANFRRTPTLSNSTRITKDPSFHTLNELNTYDVEANDVYSQINVTDADENVIKSRSHFLDTQTMQRLRQLIFIGSMFGTFPWRWNNQTCRLERRSPFIEKLWLGQWIIGTIQASFLICFQFKVVVQSFMSDTLSNRTAFMISFGLFWNIYSLVKNINLYLNKENTRKYVNAMLSFNHKYVQKYLIHLDGYKDKATVLMSSTFFICCMSQIPLCVVMFIFMPFLPWFLFSFVYPKPSDNIMLVVLV